MKKTITIFLLLFTLAKLSYAQTFPVSASTQLTPPYSIYLADYVAPGSNRLALNIFLGDINRPELQTRLRLRIEGQGILLETKAEFLPPPLIIQGGVPERLIATDLADYFQPENLNFQGITRQEFERTGTLPEGLYQFCFEVLEYNRGVTISNRACAMAWLILNDPPLINLPKNEEKVRPQDPQYVTFQWTPRHTASPNSAFTTEYDFSLVEIWPEGRNPNDAILTTPPIFEITTQSTTLIYGPAETPLVPGRKYAFRVRARSIVGVEELDLFKNNGYSQTATFQYGDPCNPPRNIQAGSQWSEGISVDWEPITNHTGFTVRYREKGDSDNAWFEEKSLFDHLEVVDLKPSTTYEYQVSGTCSSVFSEFSTIQTVTTEDEAQGEYVCGLPPEDYQFENTTPLPQLNVDDIIDAGDFKIKIVSVTGSSGNFSGKGVVQIPFFNNVNVEAEFNSISVNDEYRMIAGTMDVKRGTVDVLPDEITDFIDDLDEVLADIDDVLEDIGDGLDLADGILDGVKDLADDILDDGPFSKEEEEDLDGNTVEEYRRKAKEALKDAASAIAGGSVDDPDTYKDAAKKLAKAIELRRRANRLEQIYDETDTLRLVAVEFYANEKYGFDKPLYPQHRLHYNLIRTIAGDSISVPWAAGKSGEGIRVSARLIPDAGLPSDSITFKMDDITLSASQSGNDWTVTIPALQTGENKVIRAINIPSGETVGKLDVTSYSQLDRVVNIIPVGNSGGISESQIRSELAQVYDQAVATWKVNIESAIQVDGYDGTLQDDKQATLSVYSEGMRAIIKSYKENNDIKDNEFYLFLVDKSQTSKAGYMPRKRRYGFIYMGEASNPERTIAHELGHGAFRLQHTFEQYPTIPGITENLMDSLGNGSLLRKYQWDLVHNPPVVIGLLEDIDEGASYYVKTWFRDTDIEPNLDSTFTFVSPSGQFVTLPYDVFGVTINFGIYGTYAFESESVPGTLKAFSIPERDENGILKIDENGKAKFFRYTINTSGHYVDGIGSKYSNELSENLQRSDVLIALPYQTDILFYEVSAQLSHYNPDGSSELLNFDNFPIKQIQCETDDCVVYTSSNRNVFGEEQDDFKEGIVDIVYANQPSEHLIYLSKIAELGNAYPRLFEDIVSNDLLKDINSECGTYIEFDKEPLVGNPILKRLTDVNCNCRESSQQKEDGTIYTLTCTSKDDKTYPKGEEYLKTIYSYFLDQGQESASKFEDLVIAFNGGDNEIFNTCSKSVLLEGINYVNSDYISNSLNANAILSIISRLVNEYSTSGANDAKKDAEGAIVKLITYTNKSQNRLLIEGLEGTNLYDSSEYLFEQLFESVDDKANWLFFKTGDPNRLKAIGQLTVKMLETPDLYQERLTDAYTNFGSRIFILEHNNVFKQLGKSLLYEISAGTKWQDELAKEYSSYDIDYSWLSDEQRVEIRQHEQYGWYETTTNPEIKIRPFDLVIFVNNSNLTNVKQLLRNPRITDVPLPAIALIYSSQAGSNETVDQSLSAVIDVASLIGSGGSLTAIKGLTTIDKMRKAFLIADMASSGLSIAATSLADQSENAQIKNTLQSLSAVTGILSLGDLAVVRGQRLLKDRFNSSKNLAENLGDLPTKDKIEAVVETINSLDDAELKAFIKGYRSDAENALSIVIKYLKDAVNAENASSIDNARSVIQKMSDIAKTIEIGNDLSKINRLQSYASIDIKWKNIDQTEVWFSADNNATSINALGFWDEVPSASNALFDLTTPNGLYVKFDANDGRILLGDQAGNYHGFGQINPTEFNVKKAEFGDNLEAIKAYMLSKTSQLEALTGLSKRSLDLLGKTETLSNSKVNTLLGRFIPDINGLFGELGSFKNIGLGEVKGGINLLNRPDAVANNGNWWIDHNMPWLDKAIERGDDIYLATMPGAKADIVDDAGNLKGAFAQELNHLVDNSYQPKNITDAQWDLIKNWLGKSDIGPSQEAINIINELKSKVNLDNTSWQIFESDFSDDLLKLRQFSDNPSLVDAWKVLDDAGVDNLRKNTDFLETTSKYTDGTLTRKFEEFGVGLEEEAIIRHYTGPSHSQLNKALEGVEELTPELSEYKNLLDQALSKLPNHQGEVFRGLGKTGSDAAKTWQVGDDVNFKAFKSTSRAVDEADNFMFNNGGDVLLIIESKTGKAVDKVSIHPNELEVLFESGKNFKVDDINFRPRFEESDPFIKEIRLIEL